MKHAWDVTPRDAVAIQKELRSEVKLVSLEKPLTMIGGSDVSMGRFEKDGFAGFVVLSYPEMKFIGQSAVRAKIPFPYIPGLLSFREIPMLLAAWNALEPKPDLVVVDGVGIAHPRRLGIASHLGLVLDIPTIGVSKRVLTGVYEEPADTPGSWSYLKDHKTGEEIGAALRTKRGVKPVFVSPGHLITLRESIDIVYRSVRRHRLPESTRLAHIVVNEARRSADDALKPDAAQYSLPLYERDTEARTRR